MVACGIWAPVVAIVVFAAASARRPGYDHVADTISKLNAQGTHDWLWTGGLVTYAILMGLFAFGLRRRFGNSVPADVLWGALLVHGALMVGMAIFRDDVRPGGFFTLEGALHDVLAGMAFSALVVAMLGTLAVAKVDSSMIPLRATTWSVGTAMTTIGIAFLFTPAEVQGIPQRAFAALATFWIIFFAARCMPPVETGSPIGADPV